MAATSTIPAAFNNADWSLGTGFTADSTDPTRLVVVVDASTNLATTFTYYDLTASTFSWKIERSPATSSAGGVGTNMSIEMRDAASVVVYRVFRGATTWSFTKAGVAVGSTWTDVQMRTNPYGRFRESGGTTYFEYSPDGSSWSQPTSNQNTANHASVAAIRPRFQPSTGVDGGIAWFQQLNGATAPSITGDPTIQIIDQTVTAAAAALNASPTVPGSATGDLSILIICGKLAAGTTGTSTTPSGWTIIGAVSQSGTASAVANDTGDTFVAAYYRTDTGYGAPTISTTNMNSMGSGIAVFRSSVVAGGGTWDVSQTTTGSDTASAANISITGAGGIDLAVGDIVIAIFANSGDIGTTSAYTIAASGATMLANATETPIKRDVTTGNDSRTVLTFVPVFSGSSSAAPTYAITNGSATTGHARFLRIRDTAGAAAAARYQQVSSYHRHAVTRAASY